jgi:hypothetical protein
LHPSHYGSSPIRSIAFSCLSNFLWKMRLHPFCWALFKTAMKLLKPTLNLKLSRFGLSKINTPCGNPRWSHLFVGSRHVGRTSCCNISLGHKEHQGFDNWPISIKICNANQIKRLHVGIIIITYHYTTTASVKIATKLEA